MTTTSFAEAPATYTLVHVAARCQGDPPVLTVRKNVRFTMSISDTEPLPGLATYRKDSTICGPTAALDPEGRGCPAPPPNPMRIEPSATARRSEPADRSLLPATDLRQSPCGRHRDDTADLLFAGDVLGASGSTFSVACRGGDLETLDVQDRTPAAFILHTCTPHVDHGKRQRNVGVASRFLGFQANPDDTVACPAPARQMRPGTLDR